MHEQPAAQVKKMVVKSEANCPKRFGATDYSYPQSYGRATGVFTCTKAAEHQFVEDGEGFLIGGKIV